MADEKLLQQATQAPRLYQPTATTEGGRVIIAGRIRAIETAG